VLEERGAGGAAERTIDVHPRAGYRLCARHFGLARVDPSGAHVECAPPGNPADWRWQRFLIGRVLPWASVLSGHEVLHASAVALDGRAVAFVGPTGAGKTSLALALVARGADFVTDDVLALDRSDLMVRAHPGAALASVRPSERDAIPPGEWDRLGRVLGHGDKTYLALPAVPGPLPVAALCFLSPDAGAPIEPLAAPDPRLLLASTFVLGVRTPARLANQLDVCAALARDVPLLRVRVDPAADWATLARDVHEHLETAAAE
jgi:hypothetical protein